MTDWILDALGLCRRDSLHDSLPDYVWSMMILSKSGGEILDWHNRVTGENERKREAEERAAGKPLPRRVHIKNPSLLGVR